MARFKGKARQKLGMLRALDKQRKMRNVRNAGPSVQKSRGTSGGGLGGPFFRNPGRFVPDKKKK